MIFEVFITTVSAILKLVVVSKVSQRLAKKAAKNPLRVSSTRAAAGNCMVTCRLKILSVKIYAERYIT